MPEGLDPIEAGKKLHEHGEAEQQAEEAEEKGGHGGSGGRHSRIVQICEAVLLALVTITAAWAGYSASKWSTASRIDIARASALGNLATRDDLTAISLRNLDAATFNAWFIAFTLNSPQKEAIAVRRFRPEFLVAFNAWIAAMTISGFNRRALLTNSYLIRHFAACRPSSSPGRPLARSPWPRWPAARPSPT
jgi:hypothetical protein